MHIKRKHRIFAIVFATCSAHIYMEEEEQI